MATGLCNEEPCCVVVIFGIPGAGKSYLSRGLVSRADKVFGGRSRVIHVHMDDYYPIDNRRSNEPSIENDRDVGFNWKRSRQSVTGHIEDILSGTMSSHNPLLQCHPLVVADHGSSNILIVDDNLPLRAMRHEYYQLARKYCCGFVSIYLECSVEVALLRNSQRSSPLLPQTIITMATMVERPSPHWERDSVIINSSGDGDADWMTSACHSIGGAYRKSMEHPLKPVSIKDESVKLESQRQTADSMIHQSDIILRQVVSTEMSKLSGNSDTSSRQEMARRVNDIRKCLLKEVQTLSAVSYSMDDLREILKFKFDQHLKKTIN